MSWRQALSPCSISAHGRSYFVDKLYAKGASCLVYIGYYEDALENKHKILLKELYPRDLSITRDEKSQHLIIPPPEEEAFSLAQQRFREGYTLQVSFRNTEGLVNITSDAYEIFSAHGTLYMLMSIDEGLSYREKKEESLRSVIGLGLSLSRAVLAYHKQGYLHLDIKDDNIFILSEGDYSIKLFDFDTVCKKTSLEKEGAFLHYNQVTSPPEQMEDYEELYDRTRCIDERSDYYAIGRLLFLKIKEYGLLPIKHRVSIDGQKAAETTHPLLVEGLIDFFERTQNTDIEKRYGTGEELLTALEHLYKLSQDKLFIPSNLPQRDVLCLGREKYLNKIHDVFEEEDCVVLRFLGGIGKTTLAKKYAQLHRKDYDTILFLHYDDSVMDLILSEDIRIEGIGAQSLAIGDKDQRYRRKLTLIRQILQSNKKRSLLIVDALDSPDIFAYMQQLFSLPCKLLISSRNDFKDYGVHQITVDSLDTLEDAYALFRKYFTRDCSASQEKALGKIIEKMARHTLTLVLLAKSLEAGGDVDKMLSALLQDEGFSFSTEKIRLHKDEKEYHDTIDNILLKIFDYAKLGEAEVDILKNLSLFSVEGIEKEALHKALALKNYEDINGLIKKGWVYCTEKNMVYLHQVVADLLFKKLRPTVHSCKKLFAYLIAQGEAGTQEPQSYDMMLKRFSFMKSRFSPKDWAATVAHETFQHYQLTMGRLMSAFTDFHKSKACFQDIVAQNAGKAYVQMANSHLLAIALNFEDYQEAKRLLALLEAEDMCWASDYYRLHLLEYKGWYVLNTDKVNGFSRCIALQNQVIEEITKLSRKDKSLRKMYLSASYSLAVAYYRRRLSHVEKDEKKLLALQERDSLKALAIAQAARDDLDEFRPLMMNFQSLKADCYESLGHWEEAYRRQQALVNAKLNYYKHKPVRSVMFAYRNLAKLQLRWLQYAQKEDGEVKVPFAVIDVFSTLGTLHNIAHISQFQEILVFILDVEYQLHLLEGNLPLGYTALLDCLHFLRREGVIANTNHFVIHCKDCIARIENGGYPQLEAGEFRAFQEELAGFVAMKEKKEEEFSSSIS